MDVIIYEKVDFHFSLMKLWRAFYYILNSFLFDEMVTSECFRDKEGENEAGFSGDLEKFEIEKVKAKKIKWKKLL